MYSVIHCILWHLKYTACNDGERFQAKDEVQINSISSKDLISSHSNFNKSRYHPQCSAKIFTAFSICEEGGWSDICDHNFTLSDATVMCRQLGYADIGAFTRITITNTKS